MQKLAKVPLLIGGDFERVASMRVSGTVKCPHTMAFAATGSVEYSRYLGLATARESRALGVHWVYAPDADVNNNPENPIINIRFYGEDPAVVAEHVRAYIEGAKSDPANPVLVTLKPFPGHGDTATDSHYGMPKLGVDRERLDRGACAGPDRGTVDDLEANHYWAVARGVKVSGIDFYRRVDMAGLAAQYTPGEAAVRALEAGVDVLVIPSSPECRSISGVKAAIRSGRLTQARVDASVRKVLRRR